MIRKDVWQIGGNLETSWEVSLSRYMIMDLNEFPWAAIITFFPDRSWGWICSFIYLQLESIKCSMSSKKRKWWIFLVQCWLQQMSRKRVWASTRSCVPDLWNKQQLFQHTFPSSRHWEVVYHNSGATHELVPSHICQLFPAYWDLAVPHT